MIIPRFTYNPTNSKLHSTVRYLSYVREECASPLSPLSEVSLLSSQSLLSLRVQYIRIRVQCSGSQWLISICLIGWDGSPIQLSSQLKSTQPSFVRTLFELIIEPLCLALSLSLRSIYWNIKLQQREFQEVSISTIHEFVEIDFHGTAHQQYLHYRYR